ncbi:hypothetical protein [Streptomyces luteireticuli]|uniref:Secreted protein n=1 Tax=Streptomyces luteireticuli TaxID=173858 RepID=A0ABN0YP12_9ACTN
MLVAGAAIGVIAGGTAMTTAAASGGEASPSDTPPSTVEDFTYPNADKIFEDRGIKLKRGDGNIMLVACDDQPGLIEVDARKMKTRDKVGQGKFCFRVTGTTGYLSLELPRAYTAKGNDYNVDVNMTTGEEEKSFKLQKNQWTAIGETDDSQSRDFTLLEITAKK